MVQIGTPRGDLDFITIHRNLQKSKIFHHFFTGDIGTQKRIDLLNFQLYCVRLGNIVDDIDDTIHYIAAGKQFNEFTGPLYGRYGHHRIQILFKFTGCFGSHTQRQCSLTNRSAIEICRLKNHGRGIFEDLGILTAHDAGKTNRLVLISNYQHAGF